MIGPALSNLVGSVCLAGFFAFIALLVTVYLGRWATGLVGIIPRLLRKRE